jgi:hypothetical protein
MTSFSGELKGNLRIIHNRDSLGRGWSAHQGIMSSKSKYVVLHDDDTWEPSFLRECVERLESAREKSVGGVVTFTTRISKTISDVGVHINGKGPGFTLAEPFVPIELLTHCNPFPPIAFLFKRDTLTRVGSYRQDLEVAEDWDFHMRFAAHYDIAVIGRFLANYHLRETVISGDNANSVFGLKDFHCKTQVILRNELIRKGIHSGTMCLADLMEHTKKMKYLEEIRSELGQVVSFVERLKTIKNDLLSSEFSAKWLDYEYRKLAINENHKCDCAVANCERENSVIEQD